MHVIFVVSAPPSCYYRRQHVIIVVSAPTACYSRCQRANIMLLCVLSASASPCIMLLWSSSRQNACLMLLSSAIANDTISHHTEFMQKHIHHDDDDDARVIGASTSSIIARSGRAPRPPRRDRVRDVAAVRTVASSANADDDSICPAASTAVFSGCRRYRDNASVDTEFFAR